MQTIKTDEGGGRSAGVDFIMQGISLHPPMQDKICTCKTSTSLYNTDTVIAKVLPCFTSHCGMKFSLAESFHAFTSCYRFYTALTVVLPNIPSHYSTKSVLAKHTLAKVFTSFCGIQNQSCQTSTSLQQKSALTETLQAFISLYRTQTALAEPPTIITGLWETQIELLKVLPPSTSPCRMKSCRTSSLALVERKQQFADHLSAFINPYWLHTAFTEALSSLFNKTCPCWSSTSLHFPLRDEIFHCRSFTSLFEALLYAYISPINCIRLHKHFYACRTQTALSKVLLAFTSLGGTETARAKSLTAFVIKLH